MHFPGACTMIEGLFQPTHLILILAIVLIVFGPGKMANLGADLGKGMRELRRALDANDGLPSPNQTQSAGEAPHDAAPPTHEAMTR
jgi:sec-independent protein translocase protein TatA